MEIDEAEFEAKLEITLDEAEKWWEELEPEVKATVFINETQLKQKKKNVKLYCKNPQCFINYLANHKIKTNTKQS